MQFEFLDIILSLGIVQAVFLSLALKRIKAQDKGANKALIQILLVTAFVLTGRMIIKHHVAWSFFRWLAFTDSIIFLFGLLNYTYVRRLTVNSDTPYVPSWKHFIPLVVCSAIFLSLKFLSPETHRSLHRQGFLYWLFLAYELTGLVSNLIYFSLSIVLLRSFKRKQKGEKLVKNDLFRFLLSYLSTIGVCFLLWTLSFVSRYHFYLPIPLVSYDFIWITIPFFIYTVAYFSLLKPELFRIVQKDITDIFRSERLTRVEIDSLKSDLERLVKEEQIYIQSDLTLRELALMLGTSSNNVSWLLNNEYGTSFYDFMNEHRVAEFLNLAQHDVGRKRTILSLAMEVGFNSKLTFNKVFKAQKSITPSEYLKSIKILS